MSYFKSFLHFICENPTSPECSEQGTSHNLTYINAKVTPLDKVIFDYKQGLILKNNKEKGEKIQRKKQNVLNSDEMKEIEQNIDGRH